MEYGGDNMAQPSQGVLKAVGGSRGGTPGCGTRRRFTEIIQSDEGVEDYVCKPKMQARRRELLPGRRQPTLAKPKTVGAKRLM